MDAIYRLTRTLPLEFARADPGAALVVPPSTFAPFNAQATLFGRRDMLWALYLPITVHGRVSNIWRSYFVQRLMRDHHLRPPPHPKVLPPRRDRSPAGQTSQSAHSSGLDPQRDSLRVLVDDMVDADLEKAADPDACFRY